MQEYPLIRFLRENRFAMLLLGLVLLFFYGAITEVVTARWHAIAIRIAFGVLLAYLVLSAAIAIGYTNRSPRTVVLLAIPTILLEILDISLLRTETQLLSHVFGMLFVGYVVVQLLRSVFRARKVTADTIFASLCAYLLLAMWWTYCYSMIEIFDPEAFSCSTISDPAAPIMRLGAEPAGIEYYFSLVTMTTLGYGDIIPTSTVSRSLAAFQAVVGQLYLAVLVARLVGMHVAESTKRSQ